VHSSQLIVTRIPLADLWDEEGQLNAHRVRHVGQEEIAQLLRNDSALIVADVGHPLRWISEQDRFTFWKAEVRGHLAPPEIDNLRPGAYPSEYCYVASLWCCAESKPIVLLEKYH
jgi:hypothetical protein